MEREEEIGADIPFFATSRGPRAVRANGPQPDGGLAGGEEVVGEEGRGCWEMDGRKRSG